VYAHPWIHGTGVRERERERGSGLMWNIIGVGREEGVALMRSTIRGYEVTRLSIIT
jgi:hypothetical protein